MAESQRWTAAMAWAGFAGVLLGQVELLGKLKELGNERRFGIRPGPENVAVIVPVKVGELDGRLRLTNSPQAGDGLRQGSRLPRRERGLKGGQHTLAAGEVPVPRVRHLEQPPRAGAAGLRGGG